MTAKEFIEKLTTLIKGREDEKIFFVFEDECYVAVSGKIVDLLSDDPEDKWVEIVIG